MPRLKYNFNRLKNNVKKPNTFNIRCSKKKSIIFPFNFMDFKNNGFLFTTPNIDNV